MNFINTYCTVYYGKVITRFFVAFIMGLVCATIIGCSMFYYGYTKDEWNVLSEEEQLRVKEEYKRVMATKNEQEAKNTIDKRTDSILDYGIKKSKP